jgi:hypothetical protein
MSDTAFTVDVDGREYLITAKHVLPNIQANDYIHVSHNGTHINSQLDSSVLVLTP